ncbi:hypothetical protein [Streptococcus suis]|uniref:hypothetical protein n=1 Tax=Streptococcus suis TaxID=1307 RepID=UPI0015E14ABF|nr:hypothetical protein [Streptococcus suis]
MTELDVVSDVVTHPEETYRRSRRASRRQQVQLNGEFHERVLKTKYWPSIPRHQFM